MAERNPRTGELRLTREEVLNGWTPGTLEAYNAERDQANGGLVGGNVVTPFTRPRLPIRIESASDWHPRPSGYDPHSKWRQRRR